MGLKEENALLLQQVAKLNSALQKVMPRLEARDSGSQHGSKGQPETNSTQTVPSLTSKGTKGTKGKSAPGKGSGKGTTTSSGKGAVCNLYPRLFCSGTRVPVLQSWITILPVYFIYAVNICVHWHNIDSS